MKNRAFKILASIMSMVMIISVVPFSSFAYPDDNADSEHYRLTSAEDSNNVVQNDVSDWVKASSAPENAEIVNTKWTYTLRSYTTSSSSSLKGWTKYDTVRTGWGVTQGPVYSNPSNGERNVQSENYISGYNKKSVDIYYRYYPEGEYYQSAKQSGWLTDPTTGNRYNYSIYEEFRSDQYNITALGSGFHVNFGDGGWVWAYYSRQEQIDDINSPVYSTRWYYQEPVYTYYFYKDNSMETYNGDPTGQSDISNVVEYVQYKICGENVYYSLNDKGLLTIGGTGDMYDYSIGGSPFYENSSIKSVVIEKGITDIGDNVFANCRNIESISIPTGVVGIGERAFFLCSKLEKITIPDGVVKIGHAAFGSSALTGIIIPDSVTSIGDSAFGECLSLSSITLSDNITQIGEHTFWGCGKLTDIIIPSNVKYIGEEAFEFCGFTDVIIPDNVESIGNSAFEGCTYLNEAYLGKSISGIGNRVFFNCSNLSIVTVTSEKITIAEDAFHNNSDNLMLVINEKNTDAIDYAASKHIPVVAFGYSASEKQLRFEGNTVVYEDLEYNYLPKLVKGYPDAEKLYFKRLEFDGVEPEMLELDLDVFEIEIDDKNINIDKKSENLAYNNLYVDFSVIRNGIEEKISFGKMFELLESEDYDAFKMHLYSDEEATEQTFIERVAQAIEAFLEDAIRVITKVINWVAGIFKKK